ncbi:MAG TPA: ChaN family lipoprotein [Burkholderiales bacterium]|nr:ChaN family lipoprotein [Burkholderiales bacterium]
MPIRLTRLLPLAAAALLSALPVTVAVAAACLQPGRWSVPASPAPRPAQAVDIAATARDAQFVLLGETHDDPDHHRWQLHTLGMLLGVRGSLVIGLEMLPRRAQPVLDRWVAGEIADGELLRATDWNKVWGYDPALYLPILHFARLQRIPLIALNVDRELAHEVGARGWASIPAARREGVGDPAPAVPAYRDMLRETYARHAAAAGTAADGAAFDHFVDAQLLWDRAFAEALAAAAAKYPGALIVGIAGSGHLRGGYGVPHQLRALGAKQRIAVWLPLPADTPCEAVDAGSADAVFAVQDMRAFDPPRLGVALDEEERGPRVREVVAGSVAERAGMRAGDRVVSAAGVHVASAAELIAAVKRQPPGTWLPLTVERSGREVELVAKFPAAQP